MLRQIGQFASKTFLLWMLLTSFIGFVLPSAFTTFTPWIPLSFRYRHVRDGVIHSIRRF